MKSKERHTYYGNVIKLILLQNVQNENELYYLIIYNMRR